MFVSPYPIFSLNALLSKGAKLTEEEGRVFTADGRSALIAGLKVLGIGKGDRVLIPAYICKVIPSLLGTLGIGYVYYPVRRDMSMDTNTLKSLLGSINCKAVLMVHYFGFVDPNFKEMVRLCRAKGVKILEDCAHALYSENNGRDLGREGDIAIFSLYKVLGSPTGGMLIINSDFRGPVKLEELPVTNKTMKQVMSLLYQVEKGIGFSIRPYLLTVGAIKRLAHRDKGNRVNVRDYNIDTLSLKIYKNADKTKIVSKRRENFCYLLKRVSECGLTSIYTRLPEGISPLGFPILLEDRDRIHHLLYKMGFLLHALWDELPEDIGEEEFPYSHYLSRRVLVLPVHQDIEHEHLDVLLDTIIRA